VQLDGSRRRILIACAQIVFPGKIGHRDEIVGAGAVMSSVLSRSNRVSIGSDRQRLRDASYHDRDVSLFGTIGRTQILGIWKGNPFTSGQNNSC
jgi:hypothetical protein